MPSLKSLKIAYTGLQKLIILYKAKNYFNGFNKNKFLVRKKSPWTTSLGTFFSFIHFLSREVFVGVK